MGRTTIVLDDDLVREGVRRFKCRSKRELVELALTELLKTARRRDLLLLRGKGSGRVISPRCDAFGRDRRKACASMRSVTQ